MEMSFPFGDDWPHRLDRQRPSLSFRKREGRLFAVQGQTDGNPRCTGSFRQAPDHPSVRIMVGGQNREVPGLPMGLRVLDKLIHYRALGRSEQPGTLRAALRSACHARMLCAVPKALKPGSVWDHQVRTAGQSV